MKAGTFVGSFKDPQHGQVQVRAKKGETASHALKRVAARHKHDSESPPMNLLITLGRNPGILALVRLLAGRTSLITGAKSFFTRGIFSPALGQLASQLSAMPKEKVAELLSLAGLLATQYHQKLTQGTSAVELKTHLDEETHYLKLREVLSQASPHLEKWTPIVSPLLTATGYGAPIAGLLNMATTASRQTGPGEANAPLASQSGPVVPMFDGTIHFLKEPISVVTQKINQLKQQIAAQERRIEQRRREREETRRARELERTLQAQQVASIARASQPRTIEVAFEPEYEEEELEQDVHYSLFRKKKGGKKKRKRRLEAESELAELQEQLRSLIEQEAEEERQWKEQQHAATLERVMRVASGTGGMAPLEEYDSMGIGLSDFNGGRFDASCCCKAPSYDYTLLETDPKLFTGAPEFDEEEEENRIIYVTGGLFKPLIDRLEDYEAWASEHGAPTPEEVLADIVNFTRKDCHGCCPDEHDYDCSCCEHKDAYDAAFQNTGRLPEGPFFSSSWVEAKLGDLPEGTYGMVNTGAKPFQVTINRNVDLPRAQVSFAHEMLHVINDLNKLELPHSQLHNAAVMLVGEVLPGLNALTEAAAKR